MSQKALLLIIILVSLAMGGCVNRGTGLEVTGNLQIHDLQGCSHISPYNGKQVRDISGIVTVKVFNGFYIQGATPDEKDCSSEGIFVFTESYTEIVPGDQVLVNGTIKEFIPGELEDRNLSTTEITDPRIELISHDNPLPEPIILGEKFRIPPDIIIDDDGMKSFEPDFDGLDFFESLESMLVQLNSGLVVGPRNRYNEVVVIPGLLETKNLVSNDGALIQTNQDANPERIVLNLSDINTARINVGATLDNPIMGIMDYSYGNFKINVFGKVSFTPVDVTIDPFKAQEQGVTIASYNLGNFSRFDDHRRFTNIAQDIVKTLGSPDILVLNEVMDDSGTEDDGEVSAELTLTRLTLAIQEAGGPEYSFIDGRPENNLDGGIAGGNIRSVILFRFDSGLELSQDGLGYWLQVNPARLGEREKYFWGTRKPMVAVFKQHENLLMIIAVHLTSRNADTPLFGDIQPIEKPEEWKRIQQAQLIESFVTEVKKAYPEMNVVVTGDFNDDPWSTTLETLRGVILSDLGETIPKSERYSFILDGNAIQLDYILTSNPEKTQFIIPHINSIVDDTLKTSDHDPVMAVIQLD